MMMRPPSGSPVLRSLRSLILWTLLLLMNSTAQAMSVFDQIVVFGDSLSDSGNAGRFSNGPVWVEYLARGIGLTLQPAREGGSNFAVGGARLDPRSGSTSLRAQADAYLQGRRSPGRILYIVYGGGNDLLAVVSQPQAAATVDAAVASMRDIVADLVRRGATDILVPNLPRIGMTPAVRAHGSPVVEAADQLAERFNAGLDGALSTYAGHSGVRLYRLDVRGLAERVRADPAASGFVDITHPCGQRGNCDGYLFWDEVHPTTRAHQRLAEAAAQALNAP